MWKVKIIIAIFQRLLLETALVIVNMKYMVEKISKGALIIKGRLLAVLLLSCLLFSCEKEEEFKIPVEVGFFVDMHRTMDPGSRLQLTEGYIVLSSFGFEGDREQAEKVRFEKEYSKGLFVPFSPDRPIKELLFQIPQGVYNQISISFEVFDEDDSDEDAEKSSLVVKGTYRTPSGNIYPLLVELWSSEEFRVKAKSEPDGNQIILKREAPASAHINLNPAYWFQAVPLALLDQAELVELNGVPTILINEDVNEEVYDILESRLGKAAEVVFTY